MILSKNQILVKQCPQKSNISRKQIFNRSGCYVQNVTYAALVPPGQGSGGTGVLERPGLDLSPGSAGPQTEYGSGKGSLDRNKIVGGGDYRVLLLDNPKHTEKLVVTVITSVVSGTAQDHAKNCFHTSRQLGMAIVCTCLKEHAEFYVQQMQRMGCSASMEPDSSVV
eukprot:TRINITY_DN8221_c1_g1_i2.p3 TRINITY_DN8221_c1_g1~~TRINITY_DN8221_c1_g1_i2.p3  ORF type:complete len:167 (-),score=17.83 TRINITY_DN8221_c1_g1_i2:163-663(-)